MSVRWPRAARVVLLALVALVLLVVAVPAFVAAIAPTDAPVPAGAELLAADIRSSFWSQIDAPLPPFRTIIRRWERSGESSYLAEVEIYDLAYGLSPRRGLALAPCWSADRTFSGGWLDIPGNEDDLRREFLAGAASCSDGGSALGPDAAGAVKHPPR